MSSVEAEKVIERYKRRDMSGSDPRYNPLNPAVWSSVMERQKKLVHILFKHQVSLAQSTVLEVGCGTGGNLLELLRMGFQAQNLFGNELLVESIFSAKSRLPEAITLIQGDALEMQLEDKSFDIVYQSTVFSSILDFSVQNKLAEKMWSWVKPGGAVLWYDFTYDNPNNPDVIGMTLPRIRQLFPEGVIHSWRVTLAPPISRRVCKLHPALYTVLNAVPLLRTHVLCWIEKK